MAYKKAKRKKTSKAGRSRRRRVSGIALSKNSMLLTLGAAGLGYFLGPKINDAITSAVGDKVDPKLIAAGEALLGFMLPKYLMKNSMPGKLIGGVMIGAGAHLALKEFGVVSGFPQVRSIAGYRDVRKIAGINAPSVRSGMSNMQVIAGIGDA
jgi:hypothetical protein